MNQNKTVWAAIAGISLLLSACQKEQDCEGNTSKTFAVEGFSRITAGSALHLNISKGNTFQVTASGCKRDIDDLEMTLEPGNTLVIDYDQNRNQRDAVHINITLPHLSALNLSGAAEGQVTGFGPGGSNLRVVLSGASKAQVAATTSQTQVELSGASQLSTSGQTQLLYGSLTGGSELRAFETNATEADLHTSGGAKAYVRVNDVLRAEASGGARVVYRGTPRIKEIVTSGGGQVVAD